MDAIPPYLQRLIAEKAIPQSQLPARDTVLLQPLIEGGILTVTRAGRGQMLRIARELAFLSWVRHKFPSYGDQWQAAAGANRAHAVALRRDSKSSGRGVEYGVLHVRALGSPSPDIWLNDKIFPAADMTRHHGLAACLISESTQFKIDGRTAIIENLECFLRAESFLPGVSWAINSAGRIPERLIGCLSRSKIICPPLLHLPDYDPVGLSDYLRLSKVLGRGVELWIPSDLEHRFTSLGNKKLISSKPRNRALLEELGSVAWPCEASSRVFQLIKETGSGLEQESLLVHQC